MSECEQRGGIECNLNAAFHEIQRDNCRVRDTTREDAADATEEIEFARAHFDFI